MSNQMMPSAQLDPVYAQVVERMKVLYHADHQERFLSIQAETEMLLHQLRARKAAQLETPALEIYSQS